MNDKLYCFMDDCLGHEIKIVLKNGEVHFGPAVFTESRFDTEDDDDEYAGQGSIYIRENGEGIGFSEDQIKTIEIKEA